MSGLAAVGVRKAREREDRENGMRCEVQIRVENAGADTVDWSSAEKEQSEAVSVEEALGGGGGRRETAVWLPDYKADRSAFTAWSHGAQLRKNR